MWVVAVVVWGLEQCRGWGWLYVVVGFDLLLVVVFVVGVCWGLLGLRFVIVFVFLGVVFF